LIRGKDRRSALKASASINFSHLKVMIRCGQIGRWARRTELTARWSLMTPLTKQSATKFSASRDNTRSSMWPPTWVEDRTSWRSLCIFKMEFNFSREGLMRHQKAEKSGRNWCTLSRVDR
jgi:hypothetical protein